MVTYAELLARKDAPAGSSWGLFGKDDELGTLNRLTPENVVKGAGLINRGAVFNLDLPLDAFDPPVSHRSAPEHKIFGHADYHRDDTLDRFFLQGSTQIDGLRHFRHPVHGFYNNTPDAEIVVGNPTLGINRMADHGIVGRGVLVDVAAYLESVGRPIDHRAPSHFSVADIDAAAEAQGLVFQEGDILLVRTGWISFVYGLNAEDRLKMSKSLCSAGLVQAHETVRWLWDHQVSLLATDNLAVEVLPTASDSPFATDPDLEALKGNHVGMMHPMLLTMLGLPLGELWWLDDLAEDCRADGVWEFFLSAHPLNLTGGVGSPANAFAIK